MKRAFFSTFILFAFACLLRAEKAGIFIPYLSSIPVIDGRPDHFLPDTAWQRFPVITGQSDTGEAVGVRYIAGYSGTGLYLIIESASDTIVIRDRAYQNGDGFHMVIARPREDGQPADEFYVLRFSPGIRAKGIYPRKGIWYYNTGLSSKPLGPGCGFATSTTGGKSYFELFLPWSEIYPYHPWFSGKIGINLCFIKACGAEGKTCHYLKRDDRMQSEQSPREYLVARFEQPPSVSPPVSLVQALKRNLAAGDDCPLSIVYASDEGASARFRFMVVSADDYEYFSRSAEVTVRNRITRDTVNLSTKVLPSGGYRIRWTGPGDAAGEISLTILPVIDPGQERHRLDRLKMKLVPGSYATLSFMLTDILGRKEIVKPYESAGDLRESWTVYTEYLSALERGIDRLTAKRGTFRRAFISEIDSTLQPYTVRIPENMDLSKLHPMIVMLHGSGSDDRGMLDNDAMANDDFIEISPYGRGTSNCFTTGHAAEDVREAIRDAIGNYPVDTSRIILAGFSMGGYGAYRVFYEYPGLFAGIAVFSGHPNLASKWIGPGNADFLQDSYTVPFKGVPVFIYHSMNDLNCPYDLTLQLKMKLEKAGARVDFVTTTEGGHGLIDNNNLPLFRDWLARIR